MWEQLKDRVGSRVDCHWDVEENEELEVSYLETEVVLILKKLSSEVEDWSHVGVCLKWLSGVWKFEDSVCR